MINMVATRMYFSSQWAHKYNLWPFSWSKTHNWNKFSNWQSSHIRSLTWSLTALMVRKAKGQLLCLLLPKKITNQRQYWISAEKTETDVTMKDLRNTTAWSIQSTCLTYAENSRIDLRECQYVTANLTRATLLPVCSLLEKNTISCLLVLLM